MTDFDFDVAQKKRIASGARHKVNGSKSKGCRLPSDSLTAAERRKLNGPVTTVNLDRPMKWDEFKDLDDEVKILYLNRVIWEYGASLPMLYDLFQKSTTCLTNLCKRLGIRRHPHGYHPTKEQRERWEAFCAGQDDAKAEQPAPEPEPVSELRISYASLTLKGCKSWAHLAEQMATLIELNPDNVVKIEVTV